MAQIRDDIVQAVPTRPYLDPMQIPSRDQSPRFHDELNDLRFQREAAEKCLKDVLDNIAPDGSALDPHSFNNTEYERLKNQVDHLNRQMYRECFYGVGIQITGNFFL
jgi:hypothetical protein